MLLPLKIFWIRITQCLFDTGKSALCDIRQERVFINLPLLPLIGYDLVIFVYHGCIDLTRNYAVIIKTIYDLIQTAIEHHIGILNKN